MNTQCDVSAAVNLARRLVWLRQRGTEERAGVAREQRTAWEVFAAAHPVTGHRSPVDATTEASSAAHLE